MGIRMSGFGLAMGFFAGLLFCCVWFFLWRKRGRRRIDGLREYLESVNTGGGAILPKGREDDFSGLQDEIYKTVTELYQTREAALLAKSHFAENLYNIAHQIKTSITSASLSLQMVRYEMPSEYLDQIKMQLLVLTHLEEALLLLARMDTGMLVMEKEEVDVFTLLELAAENLQELFRRADVCAEIPETGEVSIRADMEWTMEAVMNLMKNALEHTPPGGVVRCTYEQNPLYTQIVITDTGSGFDREDLPYLFERFYRGKNAKKGGIGIGLALSKAIIESQNGIITARNLTDGGACFEIRFYGQ